METALVVLLILVVVAAAWFVLKARADRERAVGASRLQSDLAVTQAHAEEYATGPKSCKRSSMAGRPSGRRSRRSSSLSQQERARLEGEVAAERRAAAEKLVLLGQAEARLRDAFSALSSEALRQNNQSFLELARTSLGEFQQTARVELAGRHKAIEDLVQPLKESLSLVDGKLQQVEQNRVGTQSAITEQLRALHGAQQSLQVETGRLVQALRSPNIRGQWGELQLRRVVEAAGMLEYCDFDVKESASADGLRLTPT